MKFLDYSGLKDFLSCLNAKFANKTDLNDHITNTENPHNTTLSQLGGATASDHLIRTYNSLDDIGLTDGSETIAEIIQVLPTHSELMYTVGTSHNSSEYPNTYGLCIVRKSHDSRVNLDFYVHNTTSPSRYFGWGTYTSANGVVWSGWKNATEFLPLSGGTLTGELTLTTASSFRLATGSIGTILRNDGSNTYVLLTNSGDQFGDWNDLRPLRIDNSTGIVYMQHGAYGTFFGDLNGNASSATTLSSTLPMSKGGTGATTRAGASQNLTYIGTNPITATTNDTTTNWTAQGKGTGHAFYSTDGYLIGQPSQYGILCNYTYGSEVFQLFNKQPTAVLCYRSGNASGWNGSSQTTNGWKSVYDTGNITRGTAALTAGTSSLADGNIYLQYE